MFKDNKQKTNEDKQSIKQSTILLQNLKNYLKTSKTDQKIDNSMYSDIVSKMRTVSDEEKVWTWLLEQISSFITELKQELEQISLISDEQFIIKISTHYKNFKMFAEFMTKILQGQDSFFFKAFKKTSTVRECFVKYRDDYFGKLREQLIKKIFTFINKARNNEQIPREDVARTLKIYDDLDFNQSIQVRYQERGDFYIKTDSSSASSSKYYEELFEKPYIQEVRKFYEQKVQSWGFLSTPEYVHESLIALQKEADLADYFYSRSKNRLLEAIHQVIIAAEDERLLDNDTTGIFRMLKNSQEQNLSEIYNLFKKVDKSLQKLGERYRNYVEEKGIGLQVAAQQEIDEANKKQNQNKSIQRDIQRDIANQYIENCFKLLKHADDYVSNTFKKDLVLQGARDTGFQLFLRKYDKTSAYLSQYCDHIMKQNMKEEETETTFTDIQRLFEYLITKDEFLQFYQKSLCRRQLQFQSKSREAEKQLISKMKQSVGQVATLKRITTMLDDININEDFANVAEKQFQKEDVWKNSNVEKLTVYTLNTAAWPITKNEEETCTIPPDIKPKMELFFKFYNERFNQRRIVWIFSEGSVDLTYKVNQNAKYFLTTSTYQMFILLLFNQKTTYGVKELVELTGIPQSECLRNVNHLIKYQKMKLLIKQKDDDEQVNIEDKLVLNTEFRHKNKKINITMKRNFTEKIKEETEEVKKATENERWHVIRAFMVRLMKGRRTITHNDLIKETVSMVKNCEKTFEPNVQQLKKCISSLIEEDYIKRRDNDVDSYDYIP